MRLKIVMMVTGLAFISATTPLYAQIDSVINKAIGGGDEDVQATAPTSIPAQTPAPVPESTAEVTPTPTPAAETSEPQTPAPTPAAETSEPQTPPPETPEEQAPTPPPAVESTPTPQAQETAAPATDAPPAATDTEPATATATATVPEAEPEEELPPEPPPTTDMPVVQLRALDKITARTSTFQASVDSTVKFGSLYMKPRACRKASPLEKPESAAFLQIWEMNKDGAAQWVFSGWMFASSPGLSAMDHPIYDVWVLDCLPKKDAAKEDKSEKAEQEKRGEGEISDTDIPVELETRAED